MAFLALSRTRCAIQQTAIVATTQFSRPEKTATEKTTNVAHGNSMIVHKPTRMVTSAANAMNGRCSTIARFLVDSARRRRQQFRRLRHQQQLPPRRRQSRRQVRQGSRRHHYRQGILMSRRFHLPPQSLPAYRRPLQLHRHRPQIQQ